MQLSHWVEKQGRGAISRIWRESGVSCSTIYEALRGAPISRYPVAKAISDATGGAVSIDELFAPANATEPSWKKAKRGKGANTHQPTRARRGSSQGAKR